MDESMWELSAGGSRTVIADIHLLGGSIIESSEPGVKTLSLKVEDGYQRLDEKSQFEEAYVIGLRIKWPGNEGNMPVCQEPLTKQIQES